VEKEFFYSSVRINEQVLGHPIHNFANMELEILVPLLQILILLHHLSFATAMMFTPLS
jgi:hypothetical protein